MVTLGGAVVGITSTALLRHASLAIPTATIRRVVSQLEQHGRVKKSHLGLKLQPVQLPEAVHALTQEEIGLLVIEVEPGGPAEAAGVVYGDTVLHLGDESVRTLYDLYGYLGADRSGQTVPVKLFRNQENRHASAHAGREMRSAQGAISRRVSGGRRGALWNGDRPRLPSRGGGRLEVLRGDVDDVPGALLAPVHRAIGEVDEAVLVERVLRVGWRRRCTW